MRKIEKNSTIGNIESLDKSGNVVLINKKTRSVIDEFYYQPADEKDVKKFIKRVEKLVRASKEYSNYIYFLSSEMNLTRDSLMGNITSDSTSLEFHHYPFTLYDITEVVVNKRISKKEKMTSISVAEEVLQLHYRNQVGVARLSKTNHKLAHSGRIFVPLSSVFGKVNEFINEYYDYIFDDQLEKYNAIVDIDTNHTYENKFNNE